MCPLNYNRNRKKYKHLTYQERLMIEDGLIKIIKQYRKWC